ncbi:BRO family protein, partial [Patescibacteria group bacterium]
IVDVVGILAESKDPTGYIKDMRRRDEEFSKGWGQIATPLIIDTKGGPQKINCANVEGIFRIIQSIPSKKAEPFKLWLAKVGYERLQETANPELAINRARKNWRKMGAPEKWIEQRMRGQEIRNKLTDYWDESGVKKGVEYAKLTDIIHQEWSELTTRQHKDLKKLDKENLRDAMTEAELVFTALAELSTTRIAKKDQSKGYNENAVSAKRGGGIAKSARQQLEEATGEKIVSDENYLAVRGESKRLKN